jgi:hypothetical protein
VTTKQFYQKLKVQSIDVTKKELEIIRIAAQTVTKGIDIVKVDISNTVISWHKMFVFEHWSSYDNTSLVIKTMKASLLFFECKISTKFILQNTMRQDW